MRIRLDAIKREHVLKAVEEVEALMEKGEFPREAIRRHDLVVGGKKYPPKFVLAIAHRLAVGWEPKCTDIDSKEALRTLKALGFKVEKRPWSEF